MIFSTLLGRALAPMRQGPPTAKHTIPERTFSMRFVHLQVDALRTSPFNTTARRKVASDETKAGSTLRQSE